MCVCVCVCVYTCIYGFLSGSVGKESACNAESTGDAGSVPGQGRSPREGIGNPLPYSCLGNPMNRRSWWATVHSVAKSQTWLSDWYIFSCLCIYVSPCTGGILCQLLWGHCIVSHHLLWNKINISECLMFLKKSSLQIGMFTFKVRVKIFLSRIDFFPLDFIFLLLLTSPRNSDSIM